MNNSNKTEYDKIREMGKKYNADPKWIEDMISKLDKLYLSMHELELSTKDDEISIKFQNKNRTIEDTSMGNGKQ